MANKAKKLVYAFLKEFKIKSITVELLKDIIDRQGYTIVEFGTESSSEDVNVLIRELRLSDYVRNSKGFTYADSDCRLVFINESLSESEKLIVLAHEEGHIFCGHFGETNIIGRDVMQEYEANEFAHYLINPDFGIKLYCRKKAAVLFAFIIALIFVSLCFGISKKNTEYYGDFYVTEAGEKYHERECIFVKDKTNVHRLTAEEFESGRYEPCGICLPHGEED